MYHRESTRSFKVKKWEGAGSLKTLYKAYYSITSRLKPPSDIQMREFAFQLFDVESYVRHISFKDFNELRKYLKANVPRHAYHSIALYQLPDARNMEEKGWLGSEILVDIDVDRLRGCRELKIKEEVGLVDDNCLVEGFKAVLRVKKMLYRDLGVNSRVYFSGSRGFHVIGYCEYCLTLGREERGEIASYVAGLDLSLRHIIPLKPRKGAPATPTSDDPGWRGFIGEQLELKGAGRVLDVEEDDLEAIVEELKVPADMQVTRDPSRLARLIGSINGKSSLLVVEVEGGSFKPSTELSPFKGEVTVKARFNLDEVELLGLKVGFKEGEVLDLEAPVAILLASKNIATPLSGEIWVEH
jgi:DNA primase small subunit